MRWFDESCRAWDVLLWFLIGDETFWWEIQSMRRISEMSKVWNPRTVGIRVRIFEDQDEGDDEDVRHHHFHLFTYWIDWLTLLLFFVDCEIRNSSDRSLSFSLYLTLFKKQNSCLVWGTEEHHRRNGKKIYREVCVLVWWCSVVVDVFSVKSSW